MANFYLAPNINVGAYPAANAPQIDMSSRFEPGTIMSVTLIVESVTAQITWSFDGVNDYGRITTPFAQAISFVTRSRKIWFKQAVANSVVAVMASDD